MVAGAVTPLAREGAEDGIDVELDAVHGLAP